MIIAHAPSGYVLASLVVQRLRATGTRARALLMAGILGAVAPDFDMFYFYFVDYGSTHHHRYMSHWPIVWLSILSAALLWTRLHKGGKSAALALVFALGGTLHVTLDTVAGHVWWLAPFVNESFVLIKVPALYKPWWLNFIFHWSFVFELMVCTWAALVYRRRAKGSLGDAQVVVRAAD